MCACQGTHDSTYLFEILSWKVIFLQPYVGWVRMKTWSPTSFPSPLDTIFLTSFSNPTSVCLLEFSNNNCRIKCEILSKLTVEAPDVILVSIVNFEYNSHNSSNFFPDFEHVNAGRNTLLPWSKFVHIFHIWI